MENYGVWDDAEWAVRCSQSEGNLDLFELCLDVRLGDEDSLRVWGEHADPERRVVVRFEEELMAKRKNG